MQFRGIINPINKFHIICLIAISTTSFFCLYRSRFPRQETSVSLNTINSEEKGASTYPTKSPRGGKTLTKTAENNYLLKSFRKAPLIFFEEEFYWRCWKTDNETPYHEEECDKIPMLERTLASEMFVLVNCMEHYGIRDQTGNLSLAVDCTFSPESENNTRIDLDFWVGHSSTLKKSQEIVACFRNKTSVSLKTTSAEWKRYTVFVPIHYSGDGENGAFLVRDRVRLRKTPVEGDILSILRENEPVEILEVVEGWVKIKTADKKMGWVFEESFVGKS